MNIGPSIATLIGGVSTQRLTVTLENVPSSQKLKLIKLEDVIENVNLRDRESHWINLLGELNSYDSLPNYDKYLVRKERAANKGKVIRHCNCGGTWSYTHKARHLKTKKHKSYMIGLNELEE